MMDASNNGDDSHVYSIIEENSELRDRSLAMAEVDDEMSMSMRNSTSRISGVSESEYSDVFEDEGDTVDDVHHEGLSSGAEDHIGHHSTENRRRNSDSSVSVSGSEDGDDNNNRYKANRLNREPRPIASFTSPTRHKTRHPGHNNKRAMVQVRTDIIDNIRHLQSTADRYNISVAETGRICFECFTFQDSVLNRSLEIGITESYSCRTIQFICC